MEKSKKIKLYKKVKAKLEQIDSAENLKRNGLHLVSYGLYE